MKTPCSDFITIPGSWPFIKKVICLRLFFLSLSLSLSLFAFAQSVGVGTAMPDSSAMLDVSSTTKGMLVPRMTTMQRTAIASPATGLLVFDTNTNSFWFKGGTTWVELIDSSNTMVHSNGTNIYMGMDGNVGIGTTEPVSKLEVFTATNNIGITHTDGTVRIGTKIESNKALFGTLTNHDLQLMVNTTPQMSFLPDGNVGIGTTAPTSKLEIKSINEDVLTIKKLEEHELKIKLEAEKASIGTTTNHSLSLYANNGANHLTISPLGNVGIGHLGAYHPLSFGSAFGNKLSLNGAAGDHFGIGYAAAAMRLHSDGPLSDIAFGFGNAVAFTERMRMTGSGRFGIGTASPLHPLHVIGNGILSGLFGIGVSNPLFPLHMAAGFGNKLSLSGDPGSFYGFGVGSANMMQMMAPVGSGFAFGSGDSDAFTEKMRLSSEGKLGIGTSSPSENLDVNGNAKISGSFSVGGAGGVGIGGLGIGGGAAIGGGLSVGGSMSIGSSTPDPSAALDISSTTKGFLMPRMTTEQRQSIESPAEGLTVYDMTTNTPWYRTPENWREFYPDSTIYEQLVFRNGPDEIYTALNDSFGIGTNTPEHKLHVQASGFGIAHTDGPIEMATYISDTSASIGTMTNHPFSIYSGNDAGQLTIQTDGNVHIKHKLGIGTTAPHAPLQFSNAVEARKIVLYEELNNNHRFTGFGLTNSGNGQQLRYQVYNQDASHAFYSGYDEFTSKERMRIQGNGFVGIAVPNATNRLDVDHSFGDSVRVNTHPTDRPLYVTGNLGSDHSGIEFRRRDATQGIGFGFNTIYAAGSNEDQDLNMKAKGDDGTISLFTNDIERIMITGTGNVGINTTAPNAELQLSNNPASRKLVLYENANNDHQVYGFGVTGSWLRYQSAGDHVFNYGASSSSSNELMRITSSGNVGIGAYPVQKFHVQGTTYLNGNVGIHTTTPNAPLQFANTLGNRKVVLWEGANNDHQFYGLGINGSVLRYQISTTADNHIFYAGTSATTSTELMRIKGDGNVGIGITSPLATLELARGTGVNGTLAIRGTTYNSHFNNATDEDTYIRGGRAGSDVIINDVSALGNVGIGIAAPVNELDIQSGAARTGTHATGRPLYVTGSISESSNGIEFRHDNATQGIGFGYNTMYAAGANTSQDLGMMAKGASGNLKFTTNGTERVRVTSGGNVGIGTTAPNEKLEIAGDGRAFFGDGGGAIRKGLLIDGVETNGVRLEAYDYGAPSGIDLLLNPLGGQVGIGVSSSNAQLQLGNSIQNRKIVLWESSNNDHQYYGFGVNTAALRYQVESTTANHIFYAGTGSGASNELMRIRGNGNVGIGTNAPNAPLQFSNANQNRKIVLYEGANNDHQFFGFGTGGGMMRYQVNNPADHVFFASTSATTSAELFRITGGGNVGIGNSTPHAPLQFSNTPAIRKIVLTETVNDDYQFDGFGTSSGELRYHTNNNETDHVFYSTELQNQVELMRIKGTGNVGIGGVQFPSEKLQVNGNIKTSGNVDVDGTAYMGYTVNKFDFTIPAFAVDHFIECGCPGDSKVIGGGYDGTSLDVHSSHPNTAGTFWRVELNNANPVSIGMSVYTICARVGN